MNSSIVERLLHDDVKSAVAALKVRPVSENSREGMEERGS